jgi:hypothetical protein
MSEINVSVAPARCGRCNGRMMLDKEGDSACFNCGNVVYKTAPPTEFEPMRREARRVYHGWLELS